MSTIKKKKFYLISFYRFIEIKNKNKLKLIIHNFFKEKLVRGTILISDEGINGSLSGIKLELESFIYFIKKELKIRKINVNNFHIDFLPFNRFKIRLKKEIISLGKKNIKINKFRNNHLKPSEWHQLIKNKTLKLLDVRNNYEISIGKFKNSINPNTESFREFPEKLNNIKISKDEKIGLYCTGGIRCEKASNQLKQLGYKNVYQLKGGIINYLNYAKNKKIESMWTGECFVFDDRVTVNKNLQKGNYIQCYACRNPISKADTKLKSYAKGISCKYCIDLKSAKQKKSLIDRQMQMELNHSRKKDYVFKKIYDIN